jgi:hypothetical protein
MVLLNRLLQPGLQDVSVNLGRPDIAMPEQRLYTAQIGASFQEVCCKRVPQHMRAEILKNASRFAVYSNKFPETLPSHAAAARSHKKIGARATL